MSLTLAQNPGLLSAARKALGEVAPALQCIARIKKTDDEQRIAYAEVYAPNVLDTHGEYMSAEDVAELAHRFMQMPDLSKSIDTNHDNVPNGSYPVESFIAREGDPDFTPGAWVLGTKIVDDEVWNAVKTGELNGYSFEAYVKKVPTIIVVSMVQENVGATEEANGHSHLFFARLDDEGRIIAGRTTTDAGHSHEIKKGTATELQAGHSHRYFIGE